MEHRRQAGRPYVARNDRTLHGAARGVSHVATRAFPSAPSGGGWRWRWQGRRRVILPKPASVHARVPAVRPWPMGASRMDMCVLCALSPGHMATLTGGSVVLVRTSAGGIPTAATGRAVPTQPRERLGSQAPLRRHSHPSRLGEAASSAPHPIIHPCACNR